MKPHSFSSQKTERWFDMAKLPSFFFFFSLVMTSLFSLFILYSPSPFSFSPDPKSPDQHSLLQEEDVPCDLFTGRWVRGPSGPLYTNRTCPTIPESKNCFKNGRRDEDFVNWRWRPDSCELPRFEPKEFFRVVRGKKMAFIGDSVARNHVESLLCLLSLEETPSDVYKDSENRFRTWHFPLHDFTLMILWSKFLVSGKERLINGSGSGVFDLYLDRVDDKWAQKLPGLDYAVISDAHWFFRKIYLYHGTNITGCVYCKEPNVTDLGLGFALRMSFRAALAQINACPGCKKDMMTLLRTFSPAHFENGTWNTGGRCNRTRPLLEEEGGQTGKSDLELRDIQVEEVQRANEEGRGGGKRPDGHPGSFWGNKWMRGYDDCVHWCLPGPIDAWNDLLLAVLQRSSLSPKLI
ncbi:hypothetical protein NMG60_11028343 [Bertholletia excelsa]